MKKGRTAYCIFCDDIRHELAGKFSLIGIYSSEMLISAPQFPVLLPKLAVHIWVSTPIRSPFKSVSGVILGTSGEELIKIETVDIPPAPDQPNDVSRAVIGIMAVLPPIQILKKGFLEVWMEIDGERERAGRLLLSLHHDNYSPTPALTSWPPPSS